MSNVKLNALMNPISSGLRLKSDIFILKFKQNVIYLIFKINLKLHHLVVEPIFIISMTELFKELLI